MLYYIGYLQTWVITRVQQRTYLWSALGSCFWHTRSDQTDGCKVILHVLEGLPVLWLLIVFLSHSWKTKVVAHISIFIKYTITVKTQLLHIWYSQRLYRESRNSRSWFNKIIQHYRKAFICIPEEIYINNPFQAWCKV